MVVDTKQKQEKKNYNLTHVFVSSSIFFLLLLRTKKKQQQLFVLSHHENVQMQNWKLIFHQNPKMEQSKHYLVR